MPLRSSHLLTAFILSVFLFFTSLGSRPNFGGLTGSSSNAIRGIYARQAVSSPSTCDYRGNPDLYGFGIRLGLYLQWTAALISKAWMPSLDSLKDLLDADAIFLLAIFVATSVYSAGLLEPVHDVDVLILLHMFFADVYCVFFEIAGTGSKIMPISAWGSRYRALVIGGMSAYAVWFWFIGLKLLSQAPCGSVAFLFAKVALHGRARIFFKIVAVVNCFFWGSFGIIALMAFPLDPYSQYLAEKTIRKTRWFRFNRDHGEQDPRRVLGLALSSLTTAHSAQQNLTRWTPEFWRLYKADHPFIWKLYTSASTPAGYHSEYKGKTKQDRYITQLFFCMDILIFIFSIVAIETIIYWNHISDAYSLGSTSQIIPLVIGVGNLWKIILSLLNEILIDSTWNPHHQIFRLRDGTWKSFPISKPERRLSSAEPPPIETDKSRTTLAQTLGEDYKEWLIPIDLSAKDSKAEFSPNAKVERLGIVCLSSFLLSLASDSRLPTNTDLSRFVTDLFAFAQSKELTVLGIITEFEVNRGTGWRIRELLLWPLTSQAASKLKVFRNPESMRQRWKLIGTTLAPVTRELHEWKDAKYDPDNIIDRQQPLKKARMSHSLAFSEETVAERNTWRRVWTLDRKGMGRERLAECLTDLLKKV